MKLETKKPTIVYALVISFAMILAIPTFAADAEPREMFEGHVVESPATPGDCQHEGMCYPESFYRGSLNRDTRHTDSPFAKSVDADTTRGDR